VTSRTHILPAGEPESPPNDEQFSLPQLRAGRCTDHHGRSRRRDVYIGAEQRIGDAGGRAVVEINLTRNLKTRTDVGTNSRAIFGMLYEWEY
jgi:hypothetical protein